MTRPYQLTPVYDEASYQEIQDAADVARVVLAGRSHFERVGVVDAEETLVFARQLETVRNKVYNKKYPEYIARTLLPFTPEDSDAEFLTYRVYDFYAMAKIVSDYSTDFPRVARSAREYFSKFYSLGVAYGYNAKDLRRAAKAGTELAAGEALACRRAIEMGIEDAVAVGVPSLRTFGLTNHPNVSLLTLTNGTWASATAEDILEDLNQIVTTMWTNTLELFRPDTIVVSGFCYRLLQTKLMSVANSAGVSVLDMFRKQNPDVTVKHWQKLSNMNAAGNGGRMLVYKNDPEVLEFIMGREMEIHPAIQTGRDFEHQCEASFGGVQIHHPMAVFYVDSQAI